MRPRLTPEQLADIYKMRRKAAEIAAATRQAVIIDYLRWRAEQFGILKLENSQAAFESAAEELEENRHLKERK